MGQIGSLECLVRSGRFARASLAVPFNGQYNIIKRMAIPWTVPLAIGATYPVHLGKLPIQMGVSCQWVVKHPADIEHQDSIVRLTFSPVIPPPFAKKE
jgi:hypothetical protein